jgi:prolyl-tRNA synthetase
VDKRDTPGGQRNWEWIKKGVPIRVEIGPRDITSRNVAVARRDKGPKEKEFILKEQFIRDVDDILDDIQTKLLERATALRDANTKPLETEAEFRAFFADGAPGGFALMHWAGSSEDEDRLSKEMKVTIRCIPKGDEYVGEGKCFLTGKPSTRRVVFARSY